MPGCCATATASAPGAVIARKRELAAQYPRYGYRRIRIFLERDGLKMSVDRAHRPEALVLIETFRRHYTRRGVEAYG